MFPCLQRQIKPSQPKEGFLIGKGQRRFHTFPVNFHTENFQIRIHPSKAFSAFERGARVKAVAKVHEQGLGEGVIGPCEQRGLVEQNEVIHASQSIRGGLPSRGLAQRFFV